MAAEELNEDRTYSLRRDAPLPRLLVVLRHPTEAYGGDLVGHLAGRDAKTA